MTTLNYRDPVTGEFVEVPIGGGGSGSGLPAPTMPDDDGSILTTDPSGKPFWNHSLVDNVEAAINRTDALRVDVDALKAAPAGGLPSLDQPVATLSYKWNGTGSAKMTGMVAVDAFASPTVLRFSGFDAVGFGNKNDAVFQALKAGDVIRITQGVNSGTFTLSGPAVSAGGDWDLPLAASSGTFINMVVNNPVEVAMGSVHAAEGDVLTIVKDTPTWKAPTAGGGGGGNYLPLTGGTVDGQTVLKNGKSKVNVDSGIIKLEHDNGPAYPYIEMTAQGTSTNGPLVVGGVLQIANGYRDVPATPSDGQMWESGDKVYIQSGGKTVEIKDAPASPVPLPHAVLPTYDDGSYSSGRAMVENGKLLISQTDKNGTNWTDVFLALPVGTVLTWQSDTSNTAQEHIITGAPTLGPTAAAGEKVIEIPAAASTGLISATAGTFSWPGGPPDTGHVLTATPTGMAWQAPTAGPAELPSTRASWNLKAGGIGGAAGTFYVETNGTRMQVNAVDSAGVDHTDEFHLIAPDTMDIYVDGAKHTVTVGADTNGGHRDWALTGTGSRPFDRYLDLYFDTLLPDAVRTAKVIELGGGWDQKPIKGSADGNVLTLAGGNPAWRSVPSSLPAVVGPLEWTTGGTAPGRFAVSNPTLLTFSSQDKGGADRTAALMAIPSGTVITATTSSATYTFTTSGPPEAGGASSGVATVRIPMQDYTGDALSPNKAATLSWPGAPAESKPGNVLALDANKIPAWQAAAGGAPPEVAVSATEPTDPSVLLWVKLPGGTP